MTTDSVKPVVLNAWAICLQAREEARRRGDRRVGTDDILLALFEDPSIEAIVGASLAQAREAIDALDREALIAVGLGSTADAPPLAMRSVPKNPRLRDVAQKDRLRMSPAAKKVLEDAAKCNRRRLNVTAHQVLNQILELQSPDPATALLVALGVNTSEARGRLDLRTTDD
jgi:hypothetical protein